MKTNISSSGKIIIEAENQLEAYALRKWVDENNIPSDIDLTISTAISHLKKE